MSYYVLEIAIKAGFEIAQHRESAFTTIPMTGKGISPVPEDEVLDAPKRVRDNAAPQAHGIDNKAYSQ